MADRVISDELLQTVVNYIALGSISKAMSWAELQVVIDRLQKLELAEQGGPTLVNNRSEAKVG
ncbi:MAG: hypothetical protein ACR2O4_02940 [Hyphomicrobiaceae bacterium]